ncbi:MAG: cytochrome c3 family protein [Candidatus Zixiibacteriota bacterium]
MRKSRIVIILLFFFIFFLIHLQAQELPLNQECKRCHSNPNLKKVLPDGKVISLYIDSELYYKSVHKKQGCVYCHIDATVFPCRNLQKVNCQRCHYKGNLAGAPDLDRYKEYGESVHGRAIALVDIKAPACQDCHGSHYIFDKSDTLSRTNKEHIPQTCGTCHVNIYDIYKISVHGEALRKKHILAAPSCADCHGEHTIREHTDPKSTVFLTLVSATCARCHANMELIKKYDIPTEPVETYKESFHGVAIKFGAKTVANCASCHESHAIFKSDDPRSSIHIANIPRTCGKCHPGASENFAKGKIHVNPAKKEAGIIYYVGQFFKYLTLSVMLALVVYIILDLRKKLKIRRTGEE